MRWREDLLALHKLPGVTVRTHFLDPVKERQPKITYVRDKKFDTDRERHRHAELLHLERDGEIRDLQRKVRFELRVNRQVICYYIADFTYKKAVGNVFVVEDVKGRRVREYFLKKRLMKACHGIDVLDT